MKILITKISIRGFAWLMVVILTAPAGALGQQSSAAPVFKQEELEQILAPIALHPDPLVSQTLMAATYPLEIALAERWAKQNASLKGDALTAALEKQNWDPSVKSLVNFPQVLTMMSEKLDWTQRLGDAFLADQKKVLDTIQSLRAKAQASGNLKTTKEQTVIVEEKIIKIEPANPQVVYVPSYNPTVVYGAWPYPAYPPYYYYPPGYVASSMFAFGAGVAMSAAWGYAWGNCNWGGGDVDVDVNRNTNINNNINRDQAKQKLQERGQLNQKGQGKWQHNPEHRKGVSYRDQGTAQKFNRTSTNDAIKSREQFRGRAEQGRQELGRGGAGDRGGLADRGGAGGGLGDRSGAGGGGLGDRGVCITLVADIAQFYFILRQLDLELEIARRTLKLNDETAQFYQNRLAGGVSNRLELDHAVANRSRTAAVIPDLERRIAIQENLINFLLARNPGAIPRGTALTDQYYPPTVPAGLPVALLERRPDVQSAEQLLVATNANVGAAKALFFPTFSLDAALGSVSRDFSNIADKRAAIWSVSGGFLQPVFQGWRLFWNYEGTKSRFDQALAQYEKAAQNGFREVADALVNIEKLEQVRREQETEVEALQDASNLSRLRYDTGLANYLEILIADQDLFDAELELARTRGAQLNSVVQLYRALGGGWQ